MTQTGSTFFAPLFPHVPRLTEKSRRLEFMKTRYHKLKCKCGVIAHYKLQGRGYCRACLPQMARRKLDMNYQMLHVILPMAQFLDQRAG